jgi:endonuclease/exonuclease/phosphatase family metal-dependent hydrolase
MRTFPAHLPLLALDRIWVHPRHYLTRLRAHRTPLALAASDHLPLTARLVVRAAARPGHA